MSILSYVWGFRYPTFVDALRDLDDPLTMVHLFAMLPAIDRLKIEAKRIHNCRRLVGLFLLNGKENKKKEIYGYFSSSISSVASFHGPFSGCVMNGKPTFLVPIN